MAKASPSQIEGPSWKRIQMHELLDQNCLSWSETRRALADLGRVNRILLGTWAVLRSLLPRILALPHRQLLLDVGTGAGQVSTLLADKARRAGRELLVVGLDSKLRHLVIGRQHTAAQLRVVGDARALPFRSGSFDWSLSSLLFHHFSREQNLQVLEEMRRVARRAAVVVDLRRSRWAVLLVRILLPLIGVGRTARHDGRLSVARSFSLEEVARLLPDRQIQELRPRFPLRFSLVVEAARLRAEGDHRTVPVVPGRPRP